MLNAFMCDRVAVCSNVLAMLYHVLCTFPIRYATYLALTLGQRQARSETEYSLLKLSCITVLPYRAVLRCFLCYTYARLA